MKDTEQEATKIERQRQITGSLIAASFDYLAYNTARDRFSAYEKKLNALSGALRSIAPNAWERRQLDMLSAYKRAFESLARGAKWSIVNSRVLAAERTGYQSVEQEAGVAIMLSWFVQEHRSQHRFASIRLHRSIEKLTLLPKAHPLRRFGLPTQLQAAVERVVLARVEQ